MLRPAFLPPCDGLSTPRFGSADLSTFRRPATRRSDAYRDGAFTRWRSAARRSQAKPVVVVTAHHGCTVVTAAEAGLNVPVTPSCDRTP